MAPFTCAFVEWPDGLEPHGRQWEAIHESVRAVRPDMLVTNEMPFGKWLPISAQFSADDAAKSLECHAAGLQALRNLEIDTVISSRPVPCGERLANEAFSLKAGHLTPIHRKQILPAEPGWHEADWFAADGSGFMVETIGELAVGTLLCTELMFNEFARRYGVAGADLIAVPRATGTNHVAWRTAGAMAAIVGGSYVVSSNRVGATHGGPTFGGGGYAIAPGGELLATTSDAAPLAVFQLDPSLAKRQKSAYPCYLRYP